MVETLEHLIRRLADHPRQPRAAIYRELLRSEAFLLTVDAPLAMEEDLRVAKPEGSFPVWADRDPEMGGVWVPVFPARDAVAGFVASRALKAPPGQEFLWMGHEPGTVFSLLRRVKCFAGIRLYLEEGCEVEIPWSHVRVLSERKLPPDAPEIYEMPVAKLVLPRGARLTFGRVQAGPRQPEGRLLIAPEAGHFRPQDMRKLVRLPWGEEGEVWMACRHFLQLLRLGRSLGHGNSESYIEDLLSSLIGFQFFGEAEALCEWILRKGREAYAWAALAAIYSKTGRLEDLAFLCVRGATKYPAEKAFPLHGARALSLLGRREEALETLRAALRRFPGDARLLEVLQTLGPASAAGI